MGRLRIHRARHRRQGAQGHPRRRHAAPHPPAAARAAAPAGHGHRGCAEGSEAPAVLQLRRGASSPADLALFTRQLATLVRAGLPLEESLLAVSQQTEKPRVQSIILGVRVEGHGRPHARRWLRGVPAGLSGDLPRHGLRRRAGRTSRQRARAARRLHREPRGDAPEGPGGDALPDRAHGDVLRHRLGAAGVRGAEGRVGLRGKQGAAAAHHACADRHQRLPALVRHLSADPRHHRRGALPALAAQPGRQAPLPSPAAAPAARRQAGARLQHGALHAHVQHPLGGVRAGARGHAHRRARW